MSGSDLVPNLAKGRLAHYASLPATNDALILALLQATGLEADDVLRDADSFAAMVSGTTNEASFTNYVRKTLTGVTVTIDDTNNRVDIDCDDVVFTNAGGATNQTMGKAVILYDPDTTGGTDSDLIPLGVFSYDGTTDGSTITLQMPANGPLFAS